LQHRRVETFGEPAIDRREEIMGFGALALISPEAGERDRASEFPIFYTLATGNLEAALKA
jgi:hypothetical protein